jgi:hypothetical protein
MPNNETPEWVLQHKLKECQERYLALRSAVDSLMCHHRVVALNSLKSTTLQPRLDLVNSLLDNKEGK